MSRGSPDNSSTSDGRMTFAARPPSTHWETVELSTQPPRKAWVWFKPPQQPDSIILQFPPDDGAEVGPVTIRNLVAQLGIDATCVHWCVLFGFSFPGQRGVAPHFDQPIIAPPPGADPNVVLHVEPPSMPSTSFYGTASGDPGLSDSGGHASGLSEDQVSEIFDSMERDWKGSLQAERQLQSLQKQLLDLQVRLGMMNRDLSTDERLYSERSDQDDWQEARRALRDAAARLGRYIKEMDSGETVYAGKKRWFDNIRKSYIVPRVTFDGMEAARQEFEVYRSTMQNLANRMQSAYHHARQEGEVRAQQVLNRIAAKVTSSRNRR